MNRNKNIHGATYWVAHEKEDLFWQNKHAEKEMYRNSALFLCTIYSSSASEIDSWDNTTENRRNSPQFETEADYHAAKIS